MADNEYANSALSKPTEDAVTYNGKPLTPKRMVEIWTSTAEAWKPFHDEVRRAEGLRRGTLVREIAASWKVKHPEAAAAAIVRLHQRRTLESDLKARLSAVEPTFIRKAIGDKQSDITNAQAYQDYLNEWATSEYGIPYSTFLDLGVEVGGYLRVRLPAMADMEGRPDFFERLTERAYEKLSGEDRAGYKRDDDKGRSKRRPYVKVDAAGKEVPVKRYRDMIETESDDDKKLSPMKRADRKKQRYEHASEEHKRAVQKYLLGRPASTAQVYGGLDVAPIFKRGIGREQSVLAAAMTRQEVSVEDALKAGYGWKGMGGRQLIPKGDSTSPVGQNGCYYLYQFFLTQVDEDGHERPLVLYTLGGKGTSVDGMDPERDDAVGMIDLYDEYGIEGPLWSWHTGLKTRDRNPAYRQRPYLADLADLILGIEGQEAAIRATAQVVSFTGHVEVLAPALRGADPTAVLEAAVETDKDGKKSLKKFVQPRPGESTTTISEVVPFQQTQIGKDAYQMLASDRQGLAEAIAVDQAASAPGSSGRAIVVGETLAKVAKKDIRDEALEASRRDGEDHTAIVAAIEKKHGIRWPILKVEEPPADAGPDARETYTIAEWNPEWIGDGCFTRLKAEYPDELNLSALDEEASLADRGYSHFGNVVKQKGISDPLKEFQEVLEWKMRFSPEYVQAVTFGVAQRRGDKTMIELIKGLQAQQKLTEAGVPGAMNGIPVSALKRAGAQANDQRGSGPTSAQASRAGAKAADMQTASLNQEGQAVSAVGGSAV